MDINMYLCIHGLIPSDTFTVVIDTHICNAPYDHDMFVSKFISMYIYICVCIYVCMYVCMNAWIYACLPVYNDWICRVLSLIDNPWLWAKDIRISCSRCSRVVVMMINLMLRYKLGYLTNELKVTIVRLRCKASLFLTDLFDYSPFYHV